MFKQPLPVLHVQGLHQLMFILYVQVNVELHQAVVLMIVCFGVIIVGDHAFDCSSGTD